MIRKFARVGSLPSLVLMTILAITAAVYAQQTPAAPPAAQPQTQPQPDNQQSSSTQEASEEETARPAKGKVSQYQKWTFNVGGGASLTNGTTDKYVRGGGGIAAVGAARNYSKYFG